VQQEQKRMRFNTSHTVPIICSVSNSSSASIGIGSSSSSACNGSGSGSGSGSEKGGQCAACMAPVNVLCGQHQCAVQLVSSTVLPCERKEVVSNLVADSTSVLHSL